MFSSNSFNGQNYLKLDVTPVEGSLVIGYGSVGEANINGMQLDATAVPEPSTYILLGIALGVVGYARKRMNKQS
jgi:hypothetical protein